MEDRMISQGTSGLDLTNKVAVITGATLRELGVGIGGATARLMAARGAKVVVADLDEEAAEALAADIEASGGRAVAARVDLSDATSIADLFSFAVASFGTVDIVHNNAAAVLPGDTTLVDLDVSVWDTMFAVNVRGYALASQQAVRIMLDSGLGGAIVNTSSVSPEWRTAPAKRRSTASPSTRPPSTGRKGSDAMPSARASP
jgi:NAD(P)-dependent dehydrogenase (short-subunit alcohol dehydrogenase family)